jgi:hypothetical protein
VDPMPVAALTDRMSLAIDHSHSEVQR